jgi:hypothetical protein
MKIIFYLTYILYYLKLKLIIVVTKKLELNATRTQISDQIIQFFAFFVFSSSQAENKYKTQLNIRAITAITETYCNIK